MLGKSYCLFSHLSVWALIYMVEIAFCLKIQLTNKIITDFERFLLYVILVSSGKVNLISSQEDLKNYMIVNELL